MKLMRLFDTAGGVTLYYANAFTADYRLSIVTEFHSNTVLTVQRHG